MKIFKKVLIIIVLILFSMEIYPECSSLRNQTYSKLQTQITIKDRKWYLNSKITCPHAKAEGLLMNVRMVNSIFEDLNNEQFDSDENLNYFISKIPDYIRYGIRAFTICLQGGFPGYEGAVNSAFTPDGRLREGYLKRAEKVIRVCDKLGAGVILGCYYQRQDQILEDENAVKKGVINVVNWINESGFKNVLLEIANEYPHRGFDRDIIKNPEGMAELIRIAHQTHPNILVSASGMGNGKLDHEVAVESDFLLIHFNGTSVENIPSRIEVLCKYGKPIVCNEDDKDEEEAVKAVEVSVNNGCSWGLMLNDLNQYSPFRFYGNDDSPVIYNKIKELTNVK